MHEGDIDKLKGSIKPTGIVFPTIAWRSKSGVFCRLCRSLLLRPYICLFGGFLLRTFCRFLCNCLFRFIRNLKDNLFSMLFCRASFRFEKFLYCIRWSTIILLSLLLPRFCSTGGFGSADFCCCNFPCLWPPVSNWYSF